MVRGIHVKDSRVLSVVRGVYVEQDATHHDLALNKPGLQGVWHNHCSKSECGDWLHGYLLEIEGETPHAYNLPMGASTTCVLMI